MSEKEDTLKKALAENVQFKTEKADAARKESTAEFHHKLRSAERIMWVYLLVCVVVGVLTINLFEVSGDTKTLIACVLVLLVVYETTVLMKLWFVVAGTKLSVLKEVKQLRLEVSQLASAAGVASPTDVLSAKYEPIRGASRWERKAWIVALAGAAILASSAAHGGYDWLFGSGENLTSESLVILAADGDATDVTKITRTLTGAASLSSLPFHAPKSWSLRWIDSDGHELPYTTTPHDDHIRYDISLLGGVKQRGQVAYTRIAEISDAVTVEDGVWTYTSDTAYGLEQNDFAATIQLPEGAELVSTEPKPEFEFTVNDRPSLRFQATRDGNEKFEIEVRYRLPEPGNGVAAPLKK